MVLSQAFRKCLKCGVVVDEDLGPVISDSGAKCLVDVSGVQAAVS